MGTGDDVPTGHFAPHSRPFPGPAPSAASAQEIIDAEHLKLLRIGYFVSAGYTAFFIPFGLLYAGMGVLFSHLPHGGSTSTGPPAFMSWFFGLFGAVFTGIAVVGATLKFLTAVRLKERRSRVLCMITAGLTCLEMPYGTALGVLTFVVLGRPSVRELFDRTP